MSEPRTDADEYLDALMNARFLFWVCPVHQGGFVDWRYEVDGKGGEEKIAVCRECGRTNRTQPAERKL